MLSLLGLPSDRRFRRAFAECGDARFSHSRATIRQGKVWLIYLVVPVRLE
jgi:hypothetical protein